MGNGPNFRSSRRQVCMMRTASVFFYSSVKLAMYVSQWRHCWLASGVRSPHRPSALITSFIFASCSTGLGSHHPTGTLYFRAAHSSHTMARRSSDLLCTNAQLVLLAVVVVAPLRQQNGTTNNNNGNTKKLFVRYIRFFSSVHTQAANPNCKQHQRVR